MKTSKEPWGRFMLGALIGALVGFAAGLLNAPQSGERTRAAIRNYSEEARLALEDSMREAEAKAASVARKVSDAASNLRGKTEPAPVTAQPRAEEVG